MKHFFRKILILLGVFLASVAAFLLFLRNPEQSEVAFTVMENSSLPLISFSAEQATVNTLCGFVNPVSSGKAQMSLTPLPENRKLPVRIDMRGNTVTAISYEVRSIDGDNLIERIDLESWDVVGDYVKAVFPIKDLIREGVEYGLRVILTTEKSGRLYYYTRIVWNRNMKTAEMLQYVEDFHRAEFDAARAEKYAINWEVDGTEDRDSLSHVNIHSYFNQLTWGDLAPEETEAPLITILEMDETFGYFRVNYEVTAPDENGEEGTYEAEEYFCLQWSELRFYLMSYERNVAQVFRPSENSLKDEKLTFGVARAEDISITDSPEGNYIAFVQNGDLWVYNCGDHEIGEIFSFGSGESRTMRLMNDYEIRVMDVDDQGNLEFFVYGYMGRGAREGQMGLAYYRYSSETNSLEERLFIPSENSFPVLKEGMDRLCVRTGSRFYFLFDDTLYALDEDGKENIRMLQQAADHGFVVNADQTAVAWEQGDSTGTPQQIQVLYLDTGTNRVISAPEGEYVKAHGFVERDFVSSRGYTADIRSSGLVTLWPRYAAVITDEAGNTAAEYAHSGIYITDVKVSEGQVALERRTEKDGEYRLIEGDVLMQNDHQAEKEQQRIRTSVVEKRHRIAWLELPEKTSGTLKQYSPENMAYGEPEAGAEGTVRLRLYYAYVNGRLEGVYQAAGDAIAAVYGQMGYVVDSAGCHVWHRTAKYPERANITVGSEVQVTGESQRLSGTLDAILRNEGVAADIPSLLAAGDSPEKILEANIDGSILDLEGCSLNQLYLYLGDGAPLLGLDRNDRPLLITGYDLFNVILYDPVKGTSCKMGQKDAQEEFEKAGNRFLSYVRY